MHRKTENLLTQTLACLRKLHEVYVLFIAFNEMITVNIQGFLKKSIQKRQKKQKPVIKCPMVHLV